MAQATLPGSTVQPAISAAAPSLRDRAIHGSAWTLSGYGASQVLRFGSNLLLARLLFPEAFGLMSLVNILMQGLQMWSDLGIPQSIIQNRRSDAAFLNTAWTLQVARGLLLWLISCLLAWPFAVFYSEPQLARLIPVAGLSALIAGLNSTALYTLNRRLMLGRITLLDLLSHGGSIAIMLFWVSVDRTVWALVAGGLGGGVIRAMLSHLLDHSHHDRFGWDSLAARSMIHFGRWLFVSSMLTFLCAQADRLMLGRMLDARHLGLYSIASMLAMLLPDVTRQLDSRVMFPVYSELGRIRRQDLASRMAKVRWRLHAPAVLATLTMAVLGNVLVHLLYDTRYAEAGLMLEIIAVGVVARIICSSYGPVLVAIGATFDTVVLLITQLILLVAMAFAGFVLYGGIGFVVGVASVEWVNYLAVVRVMRRHHLWQPRIDLLLLAAGALVFSVAVLPQLRHLAAGVSP